MKVLYAAILILIYSVIVQAQIQSVIGNSGGEYSTEDFLLEYTLGEPIIPTLSNNRYVLTQGFHQPDILRTTTLIQLDDITFEIEVYPNPVRWDTTIKLKGDDLPQMLFDVVDLRGSVLQSISLPPFSDEVVYDGSNLSEGLYFLRFREQASGKLIHTTKILKLQ